MTAGVTGARAAGDPAGVGAAGARSDDARLRQAARQLTGLFAQQLFKAMRDTVPRDEGVVSGGSGEEMFTGMLDEHLAGAAPGRPGGDPDAGGPSGPGAVWTRTLAEAVFRRMRPGAPAGTAAAPAGAGGIALTPAGTSAAGHGLGSVTPGPDGASSSRPVGSAPAVPSAGRR